MMRLRSVLAAAVAVLLAACSGHEPNEDAEDSSNRDQRGTQVAMATGEADEVRPGVRECAVPDPTWIWCDDFDRDRLDRYFEYVDENGSFVREEDVGIAGSGGMRARFRRGQVDAGNLKVAFGQTPQNYFRPVDDGRKAYRDVYWRFFVRYEDGWTGGGGNKLSRATGFASPDTWAQSMIAHVWSGSGDRANVLVIDPATGADVAGRIRTSGYNDFDNLRWLGKKYARTPIFDREHVGEWYCVEAHVRLNDRGRSDGVFELWIDGELETRAEGLDWVGYYSEYGINAVFLENYWNDGAPATQERYFDGFVIGTDRIGC